MRSKLNVFVLPPVFVMIAAGAQPPAQNTAMSAAESSIREQRNSLQRQRDSVMRQLASKQVIVQTAGFIEPLIPPQIAANCPSVPPAEVDRLSKEAAQEHSLEPALVRAVMKQESGFRPCAVSSKGAEGLMQLMPSTADRFHIADPFDPKENVRAGASLLRTLLNRYNGDLKLALAAYNAGANQVDNSGGVPPFPETQNYVASILAALGQDTLHPAPDPHDPQQY